ncbi:M14 family metallopeptidase [Paucibacter sp. APW11]|uniref:M14 family metallopeptidase n=1 Tax=Roseateles aquae TaxID=3077235 RepID=A0ABU3PI62_9BURK|nr:M14 family metallopeptidase [Paucibacter sp. APW11]MDT9002259.1 M14 family metallopeptidase [Paucibacter sp. APW11]
MRKTLLPSLPLLALIALLALFALQAPRAAVAAPALQTLAEASGFKKTGRYEEVIALCRDFARAYPKAVRCERFGTTPEGRPMLALVASHSGALSPEAARRRGLPVVLMQGGIHAGEIDGKDAGFLALRELLDGHTAPGALKQQVFVFVPVFNIDGHGRFGAWQRPNQRGPEEMGWRTTAQNYNLNRDYMKADAPEMRAMLGLVQRWDPLLTVDLHVTDGAQFEHDISIQVEPLHTGDATLQSSGRQLRDGVIAQLATQGSLPQPFYMSFAHEDDPASGFEDSVPPPRFSHGYFALRNRFGMLVETHSWKDYPTRVRITRNTIVDVLQHTAAQGKTWQRQALQADAAATQLAGQPLPLSWKASERSREIEFRGYAYTRTPSEVSGALMTRYDESRPQLWRVPLRDELLPALSIQAPKAGYLVPAAEADRLAPLLRLHGIAFRRLKQALPAAPREVFLPSQVRAAPASFEGRQRLEVSGQWQLDERGTGELAAGALFVPIAQPRARLLVALLEPQAPDSLLAWGQFNTAFERKEYMEGYVAEQVAREQLAADPALAAAFQQRLADDPAFAANPRERLDFFYRRHPAWDVRFQRYPVLRVDSEPGSSGHAKGR